MLGLGNSLAGGAALDEWTPLTPSGLQVWLKAGTGMSSNQDESGTGHTRSTAAGNMADTDRINSWADQSGNGNDATQSTGSDMPKWDSATADAGAAHWDSNNKWLDLDSNVTFSANEDFTVIVRFKRFDVGRALLGHATSDFLKIHGAGDIRFLDGGSANAWAEASLTLTDSDYYILVLTRSDGSTGNLHVHINGGVHSDVDWDAAESHTETSSHTISNIGASVDDGNEWKGHIKDVLIYKGYAFTSDDRSNLYNYIANQTQEQ